MSSWLTQEERVIKIGQKLHWWNERLITLMVIPERTRRVHRFVVPLFVLKISMLILAVIGVVLLLVGLDYVHVVSRLAENKRLKGENFKLRQELQLIRNKVDTMESTLDRVSSYAKKLQMLTGQGAKGEIDLPLGPSEDEPVREPASKSSKSDRRSQWSPREELGMAETAGVVQPVSLVERMDALQHEGWLAESRLTHLQVYLFARKALLNATPSLVPISGWITSSFGYRRHPYDGGVRLHSGIDIAADPGTPVRAPADGLVSFSGYREGYGKVIVIDHGYGIRTLFAHNSKLFVTGGTRVRRGEILSEVGSTGMSTGPHLHYEVRKNGVAVNPAPFFSRSKF